MASDDPTLGNRPPSPTQYQRAGRDSGTSLMRIARWFVLFVYSIAIIATVVLTITFFLRLFGANTSAPFVEWVYRSADRMQPFRGIFPPIEVSDRSVLDVAVLFGILMYGLFAVAVHAWSNGSIASSTSGATHHRFRAAPDTSISRRAP